MFSLGYQFLVFFPFPLIYVHRGVFVLSSPRGWLLSMFLPDLFFCLLTDFLVFLTIIPVFSSFEQSITFKIGELRKIQKMKERGDRKIPRKSETAFHLHLPEFVVSDSWRWGKYLSKSRSHFCANRFTNS